MQLIKYLEYVSVLYFSVWTNKLYPINLSITELNNMVNIKLDSGWTLLMHACFHAQDKIVKFLLAKGADPNLHAGKIYCFYLYIK